MIFPPHLLDCFLQFCIDRGKQGRLLVHLGRHKNLAKHPPQNNQCQISRYLFPSSSPPIALSLQFSASFLRLPCVQRHQLPVLLSVFLSWRCLVLCLAYSGSSNLLCPAAVLSTCWHSRQKDHRENKGQGVAMRS